MSSEQITLRDINGFLNQGGMPSVTADQCSAIVSAYPRDTFISAIKILASDVSARKYVRDVFEKMGILSNQTVGNNDNMHGQSSNNYNAMNVPQRNNEEPVMNDQRPANGRTQRHEQSLMPRQPQGYQNTLNTPPPVDRRHGNSNQNAGANNAGYENNPAPVNDFADRKSLHVYGGKAALCFEMDKNKRDFETLAFDAATSVGNREYDWKNKTRIQLTKAELPVVASVFLGFTPSCEFKSHGVKKDKGFSIENQGEKVFFKVFEAGKPVRAVPIESSDMFYVCALVLEQISKATGLPGTEIISLLRIHAARSAQKGQQQKSGYSGNPRQPQNNNQGYQQNNNQGYHQNNH